MEFINRLKHSAYDNLSTDGFEKDLSGWMDGSLGSILKSKVEHLSRDYPLLVVEVGSWKGLSSVCMAETLKTMGFTNFNILCVDTWLGAPEFWTYGIDESHRGVSLNIVDGYPSVFKTFTRNVKLSNCHDVIAPFPLSSQQALEVCKYYKLEADVIYIDASHEYEAVKSDIEGWMQVLKNGGTMFGDDYSQAWPGVVRAVNEQGTPEVTGVVWLFKK